MAKKTNKTCECKNCKKLQKKLEKAIYELSTSYGVWCIDLNPKFETIETIRKNAWRFLPKIPKLPDNDS